MSVVFLYLDASAMVPSVAFDNPAKLQQTNWLKEETLIGRLTWITFPVVAVKWISRRLFVLRLPGTK